MAEIIRGRSSVRGVAGTKRMALVGVTLVAALTAALLVASGVGPGAAEAQTAQTSGTVVAWGDNTYGQSDIPPNLTGVEAISGGGAHSLALKDDGTVIAWGANFAD